MTMMADLIPFSAVTATAHQLAAEDGFQHPLPEHFEVAHDRLYDRYAADYLSWYDAERESDDDPSDP